MSLQLQQKERAPFMIIPGGPSSIVWVYVCTWKCVCVFNLSPSYHTNNWKQIMLQVKEQPVISSNGPSVAPK